MKKKAMYGMVALALMGILALGFTAAASASAENTAPVADEHPNIENAPDADGDGIPNGMDSDFERPMDGTGQMHRYGGSGGHGQMNGDCNGDGMQKMYRHGYRYQNQETGASAP